MIWRTSISWLQSLGYSIALAGLVYYSLGWDQIAAVSSGAWAYARSVWYESVGAIPRSSSFSSSGDGGADDAGRLSAAARRALVVGVATVVTVMLVGGLYFGGLGDGYLGGFGTVP